MIAFLVSLTIGVAGMALCPFEHEPLFKEIAYEREEGDSITYESTNKREE